MKLPLFDREKHVYHNDAFVELVKDAVRFFNGTPAHTLPPPTPFYGTGVYAIYYVGGNPLYGKYAALNRLEYSTPIYVGKAVPKGWRQSRTSDTGQDQSKKLYTRLKEHTKSLDVADGLSPKDFMCRLVIFERDGSDMIGSIEAALIRINLPLWNTVVDGFGNHDPGKGRYEQAKSDWDVVHAGRPWAEKCNGEHSDRAMIIGNINKHQRRLK